jgi:hypothetical protein
MPMAIGDGQTADRDRLPCAAPATNGSAISSATEQGQPTSVGGDFGAATAWPLPRTPLLEATALPSQPVIREIDQSQPAPDPQWGLEARTGNEHHLQAEEKVPWASLAYSVAQGSGNPYDPAAGDRWKTEESLKVTLPGTVSVFGQVGAGRDPLGEQDWSLSSQTGLAWKVPGWPIGEVQFRGGPKVTCNDSRRTDRLREKSELLVEMLCSCPLPGRVKVEYQSSAVPALSPVEHDRVDQDLRVAFPVAGGQLRMGAKHSWENLGGVAKPWTDGMQLYLGLALGK